MIQTIEASNTRWVISAVPARPAALGSGAGGNRPGDDRYKNKIVDTQHGLEVGQRH
jgi:hypothetical protein